MPTRLPRRRTPGGPDVTRLPDLFSFPEPTMTGKMRTVAHDAASYMSDDGLSLNAALRRAAEDNGYVFASLAPDVRAAIRAEAGRTSVKLDRINMALRR